MLNLFHSPSTPVLWESLEWNQKQIKRGPLRKLSGGPRCMQVMAIRHRPPGPS